MHSGNLFAAVPGSSTEELVETLVDAWGMRIERIVSTGQASPGDLWYDQDGEEYVALLQGAAALEFEGDPVLVELSPGDWITIPAHRRHRVAWTSASGPTVWLAVHYRG